MERQLLDSESNNPLDHSIEAILPGVHSRMATTQAEVASASRKIDALDSRLDRLENMQHTVMDSVQSMMLRFEAREEALADHLSGIVNGIRGNARSVRRKIRHSYEGEEEGEEKVECSEDLEEARNTEELECDEFGIPVTVKSHHIKFKHQSLFSMHDEWFGLHSSKNKPVEGGLDALETSFKSKWRKHFTPSEEKAFSRLKRIMKAIKEDSIRRKKDTIEVCCEWNEVYEGECKKSLSKMEDWLKQTGFISTAAPRGKAAK